MHDTITFHHPEPKPATARIWPVFLPFAGCPYRCVFCAQDKQTGQMETELGAMLESMNRELAEAAEQGKGPYELAFYGGTFTALPAPWAMRFLEAATHFRNIGLITRVRCSTRPDCIDEKTIHTLRKAGLDMIELGVQSFDDAVLQASGRGYSGETARKGCELVKAGNMALGIQLLPGLPGDREGVFQEDARIVAALQPEIARIYPCQVIDGTPLATMWRRGDFTPWELERTKEELAEALLTFWGHHVRVIRLGLPPEPGLSEHVLAGPQHPALGQSARALALQSIIRSQLDRLGGAPGYMEVPRRYQGELFGNAGELKASYAAMGITRQSIRYVETERFLLRKEH